MAALQCEICGGKLVGKPGGMFECDSCGMEYSTEWAKAKVQEIKGTVKIEGPVEVTGTVKVEGGPSVENLLKRGMSLLQGENWRAAADYFNRVLEMEPENVDAYMGLAMAAAETPDRDAFADAYVNGWIDTEDASINQVRLIAGPRLKAWLEELETERQQIEEDFQQMLQEMDLAAGLISAGAWHTVGLRTDGRAVIAGSGYEGAGKVGGWVGLAAVSAGHLYTVDLLSDGTAVAVGKNEYGKCKVGSWRLFNSWSTWGDERIAVLEAEKASIQAELPTLQGLFSGGKRRELEARLAQIEEELSEL